VVAPAHAKVHVGVDVVKAFGAEPLRQVLGLCIDREQQGARRTKDAGDDEWGDSAHDVAGWRWCDGMVTNSKTTSQAFSSGQDVWSANALQNRGIVSLFNDFG
jgi:hypothetical protein